MPVPPTLSVVARSTTWRAIIERQFADAKISWALDIDDVLAEVERTRGRPVVIELAENRLAEECRRVLSASNHPCQSRFFAIGANWNDNDLALIRSSGFVDICTSAAGFRQLQRLIRNQFRRAAEFRLTIEEQVSENLPWKPAIHPI